MRLNRYLSLCGLGSRRGCELLISEGRVSINGHVIKDLATQVTDEDRVVADGHPVKAEANVVIALHKPRGYICSRSDERDRMTIYSLLPKQFQTLHHVGRLDKDSEGLLIMTNQGELSHRLIHPSMGAEKEYEVIIDKPVDQAVMAKLVKGMLTEEGHAKCERAWMASEYRCHVVLKQGLKRQIRLMFYQLGFEVERLTRTRIGWLELKGLQKGGWKQLTEVEVQRFFAKDGTTGRPTKPAKARVSKPKADSAEDARPVRRARPEREDDRRPGSRGRSSDKGSSRGPRSRSTGDERTERPFTKSRSAGGPRGRTSREDGPSRDSERPRTGFGGARPFSRDEDRPSDRPRGGSGRGRPFREDGPARDSERPRSGPSRGRPNSRSGDSSDRPRSSSRPSRDNGPSRGPRSGGKRPPAKKGPRRRD